MSRHALATLNEVIARGKMSWVVGSSDDSIEKGFRPHPSSSPIPNHSPSRVDLTRFDR